MVSNAGMKDSMTRERWETQVSIKLNEGDLSWDGGADTKRRKKVRERERERERESTSENLYSTPFITMTTNTAIIDHKTLDYWWNDTPNPLNEGTIKSLNIVFKTVLRMRAQPFNHDTIHVRLCTWSPAQQREVIVPNCLWTVKYGSMLQNTPSLSRAFTHYTHTHNYKQLSTSPN